jgi:hypothetical protein
LDIKAQDSLFIFLKQESMEPVVLVHRGHSYHLDNTLKRLTPSVKLAILGSCGGANSSISIASINTDAQLIVSKKMGSKSINDPIINVINETLLNEEDLLWPVIWESYPFDLMVMNLPEILMNIFLPEKRKSICSWLLIFTIDLFRPERLIFWKSIHQDQQRNNNSNFK